jgi:UDP-N-acetylmuramyl tripeptide synthase
MTSTGIVRNRDDSFVARLDEGLFRAGVTTRWFGIDPAVADDLPPLHEADARFDDEFRAPEPTADDGMLHPNGPSEFRIDFGPEPVGPLVLKQRGLAAMINATAATTTARLVLGEAFRPDVADEALRAVTPPFGRGEVIDAGGYPLELVLVKNPAGFTVALGTYHAEPVTTMVAINDDYADGQDVSWLYDVSFESLRENGVALTSGVRAYDMALRLDYDDVAVASVEPDLERALDRLIRDFPAEPRRIFCTYTAMMRLRRLLAARYGLTGFGEETE